MTTESGLPEEDIGCVGSPLLRQYEQKAHSRLSAELLRLPAHMQEKHIFPLLGTDGSGRSERDADRVILKHDRNRSGHIRLNFAQWRRHMCGQQIKFWDVSHIPRGIPITTARKKIQPLLEIPLQRRIPH